MSAATITDVTRMAEPRVCIAALDGIRTIRLNRPQPDEAILASIGGLITGDQIVVDWQSKFRPERPHVEDGFWKPGSLQKIGRLNKSELTDLLRPAAVNSVEEAFGSEWFRGARGNGAFKPGQGSRSLASVLAREVRVYSWFEGVRVDFSDELTYWTMVPLEDLSVRRHQSCVRTALRRPGGCLALM